MVDVFTDEVYSINEMFKRAYKKGYQQGKEDSDRKISGEYCPKCKSNVYMVTDSRIRRGIRKRTKLCTKCNSKWQTVEFLVIKE